MIKYLVIGCYYCSILKEYSNKYSAYAYARKYKCPCFVSSFDTSTGNYHLLRAYLK